MGEREHDKEPEWLKQDAKEAVALQILITPELSEVVNRLCGGKTSIYSAIIDKLSDRLIYDHNIKLTVDTLLDLVGTKGIIFPIHDMWRERLWVEYKKKLEG